VDCVISLLDQAAVRELGLEEEALLCAREGMAYLSFPITDRGTPASAHKLDLLLTDVATQLRSGRAVIVHGRAGIGRSGIIAACLLHRIGVPANEVFACLSAARGVVVPDTDEQIAWTRQFLRG
jgi:protein-tyrosine phosphatase